MKHTYGTEASQFGELTLPDMPGPYPVAMLIHGGFWRARFDLSLMNGLAEDLVSRGVAAWNIEYRRVGDPDGGWPNTLLDVAAALEYLSILAPVYELDLARVVPIGHSAGGQLALWLAGREGRRAIEIAPKGVPPESLPSQARTVASLEPVREGGLPGAAAPLGAVLTVGSLAGAISLAGMLDLEQGYRLNLGEGAVAAFLQGSPDDVPERYAAVSPNALLPLGIPQILVHGTEDSRVPIGISLLYAQAARAAGDQVTMIELPGVDHFALIDPHSGAWETTAEALQGVLLVG